MPEIIKTSPYRSHVKTAETTFRQGWQEAVDGETCPTSGPSEELAQPFHWRDQTDSNE